jgi:hypothetical protein
MNENDEMKSALLQKINTYKKQQNIAQYSNG